MMDAILTVERWGNWLALRLPENVARAARLTANQRVRITGERGRIVIAPHAEQHLAI